MSKPQSGRRRRGSNESTRSRHQGQDTHSEDQPVTRTGNTPAINSQSASMALNGAGFNPRWGPDSGILPGFPPHNAYMMGSNPYGYLTQQQQQQMMGYYGYGYTTAPTMTASGAAVGHAGAYGGQYPRNMMTPSGRPQYPYPNIQGGDAPATNMTNSTGGVGCEPGYNYFFPAEHTKIHVLKTGGTPPWQLPAGTHIEFSAHHVPTNTTVGELMKGFGATNPVPKLNNIAEVLPAGNGRWYKGMQFCGEVKDDMAKTIKDCGWDGSRSGMPGGRPVVYLYITKD